VLQSAYHRPERDTYAHTRISFNLTRDGAEADTGLLSAVQAERDLDVISRIIINGHGSTIMRNSATAFRIIDVGDASDGTGNGNLTLNDVIISNGNAGTGNGGGIRVNQGSVLIVNTNSETRDGVTVQANTAANGGGIYIGQYGALQFQDIAINTMAINANDADGNGGGVWIGEGGVLQLQRVTVNNNAINANSAGGTFQAQKVNAHTSALNANTARYDGGGIYNDCAGKVTTVGKTYIVANKASDGGGIYRGGPFSRSNQTKLQSNKPNNEKVVSCS
jgi:hypothetical protein